ncbi:MAG: YajD family HNH nuclease [Pseudomarimonas sp.]
MATEKSVLPSADVDRIIADARRTSDQRSKGYRDRALAMYPWICGRCAREFDRSNLRELTVHHRNHDHDYNPEDGSNWELLCIYCHDNEHSRLIDHAAGNALGGTEKTAAATSNPFANLKSLLKRD